MQEREKSQSSSERDEKQEQEQDEQQQAEDTRGQEAGRLASEERASRADEP
jgi:hypothetical protein